MSWVRSSKQSILVTGSSGMLGTDLGEQFSLKWGHENVILTNRLALDITKSDEVAQYLDSHSISCVVNSAAYTDVDRAETEREQAWRLNALGPKVLAEVANERGIPLVHFSTDYVFDGKGNTLLTEEDPTSPPEPNYYGETKLEGEKWVLSNPLNLVLRVQWLYGKKRERFTQLKNKAEFTPFSDQWGAPTWTVDVSRVTCELIEKKAGGLFHFAYDDQATWAEVFQFVCEEMGYSTKLIPRKTYEVKLPARRPLFCAMSNKKLLRQLGKDSMGSWKSSLKTFLQTTEIKS